MPTSARPIPVLTRRGGGGAGHCRPARPGRRLEEAPCPRPLKRASRRRGSWRHCDRRQQQPFGERGWRVQGDQVGRTCLAIGQEVFLVEEGPQSGALPKA